MSNTVKYVCNHATVCRGCGHSEPHDPMTRVMPGPVDDCREGATGICPDNKYGCLCVPEGAIVSILDWPEEKQ
jgi:hypothetical protein